MPGQEQVEHKGGTMRLGVYPCQLVEESIAFQAYATSNISERHRHRYEINNNFRSILEDHGMKISGLSPDGRLVEIVEISDHPWFVACQFHPEFGSRPNRPHPLFTGFITRAIEYRKKK
jgi:CTP synthase